MKILKIAVSAGIFALVIVGAIYFMTLSHPKQNWVISGGEEAGKYDEVAQALGNAMADEFDPGVRIEISSGSKQNLARLQTGKADLCLVQNDIAGEKGIRSIATFYKEVLHVIVRKETASAEQLSNGTFSLGPAGGGTESLAIATLRQVGFPVEEITLRKESLEKGLQALREGQADAVCIVTGIGNASVGEFLAEGEFALLDLGGDIFESIRYSYPYAHPSSIPAGAYPVKPGQGMPRESIPTIGTTVLLACHQDLSDEHAFELARFLGQNRANLIRAHPLFAQMDSPKNLEQLQFPVHDGAQLHYDRHDPSFIQEWADTIGLILSVLAIAWGTLVTVRQIYLMRLKESLDEFFQKVEAITSELVAGTNHERSRQIAGDLHAIRRETTKKLIADELAANESFVIFQRQLHTAQQMVNEALRKESGEPDPADTKVTE
jgi:TRAP transporter TAXI family solute receptor